MTYLALIPKWALAAALAVFVLMFAGQKSKNTDLTLKVAQHETRIEELKAGISAANATAAAQAAQFEQTARLAEQGRAKHEKKLQTDLASANASYARLQRILSEARAHSNKPASDSPAPANFDPSAAYDDLLTVSGKYLELSQSCDRHVIDIKTLISAWPKSPSKDIHDSIKN